MDFIEAYLVTPAPAASSNTDIISLIFGADIIVLSVLGILVLMSIVCWGIILFKGVQLIIATHRSSRFLDAFWKAKRLDEVYDNIGKYGGSPV
ncbi:MAG: biopolymer transport protein ExbB/TolQ, partial [Kiritimatiellia bacterium]